MTIQLAKIYFVRGDMPSNSRTHYEVTTPPTSGWGHGLIIPGEKRSTIFSPFTLEAWQVNNWADELKSARLMHLDPVKIGRLITDSWAECARFGFQRDFGVAALILGELGLPVPKFIVAEAAASEDGSEPKRGGKPIDHENLKPCRPGSKRGEVATFFMQEAPQSLHEAMARLGLTRSGVLSHLFTLNKDHGVGYELVSDCARLLVPEGFDLFAFVEPERAAKAEKPVRLNDDGSVHVPKKRTGGKPIILEALKPIPEPGKRATIARLFVDGFRNLADVMLQLDLDRSAVLSHLFTINKENGLGYELSEDSTQARLLVPAGHEVFQAKVSKAAKTT